MLKHELGDYSLGLDKKSGLYITSEVPKQVDP